MIRKILAASLTVSILLFSNSGVWAQESMLAQTLTSSSRPDEDKERDNSRKPAEVLAFLGIDEGMTVMDVMAGGGYYTEVLAIAVGPNGRVISQNAPRSFSRGNTTEAIKARKARHGNIEVLVNGLTGDEEATDLPDIGPHYTDPGAYANRADAAITALNMHDVIRGGEGRAQALLENIYKILKPGGVFGVIDHRGEAQYDNVELHRITDQELKDQLTAAGFIIDAESDILSNPRDDHSLHMRDESLQRNTDRILIRARKPQ